MTFCISRRSTLLTAQLQVCDFLAPSLLNVTRTRHTVRNLSTTAPQSSCQDESSNSFKPHQLPKYGPSAASKPPKTLKPLSQAQRDFLTSALRVNQAGELAATLIYKAQTPVVVNSHPHLRSLMKHMYNQEAGHLSTFNTLLAKHRVRPTAMYPIWSVLATGLGWTTAMMGRKAAMACTEAVEIEIGSHYNEQVRELLEMFEQIGGNDDEVGDDLKELLVNLRRIRDEELEHLDHAVANDALEAVPHELLVSVIKAGCRGAIWVSSRV